MKFTLGRVLGLDQSKIRVVTRDVAPYEIVAGVPTAGRPYGWAP